MSLLPTEAVSVDQQYDLVPGSRIIAAVHMLPQSEQSDQDHCLRYQQRSRHFIRFDKVRQSEDEEDHGVDHFPERLPVQQIASQNNRSESDPKDPFNKIKTAVEITPESCTVGLERPPRV